MLAKRFDMLKFMFHLIRSVNERRRRWEEISKCIECLNAKVNIARTINTYLLVATTIHINIDAPIVDVLAVVHHSCTHRRTHAFTRRPSGIFHCGVCVSRPIDLLSAVRRQNSKSKHTYTQVECAIALRLRCAQTQAVLIIVGLSQLSFTLACVQVLIKFAVWLCASNSKLNYMKIR